MQVSKVGCTYQNRHVSKWHQNLKNYTLPPTQTLDSKVALTATPSMSTALHILVPVLSMISGYAIHKRLNYLQLLTLTRKVDQSNNNFYKKAKSQKSKRKCNPFSWLKKQKLKNLV